MSLSIREKLKKQISELTDLEFEITALNRPLSFSHYESWLKKQGQGDMNYMAENQEVREQPQKHFSPMRSLIVFKQSYFPIEQAPQKKFSHLKIAHYARNQDYHFWFREKLTKISEALQEHFPNQQFRSFTDAIPLLERDYGAQARLGWIGKNTCLIHPEQGSLFFIGEILCSLPMEPPPEPPIHDFCGSCTACMEACPTDAFVEPRVLDANLCLSHWNIESKGVPPPEIRPKMGSWFFGCDICQNVCPWNMKLHKDQVNFPEPPASQEGLEEELRFILTSSNKKLLKELKDSPLTRAGGRGLKRNAMIVAGNLKLISLRPEIEAFKDHPQLGELAQWSLIRLASLHDES